MSYYKNQSGRPISVSHCDHDACLVPPNCFVFIDPQVERRYDTKRLVRLGILVRCGAPSDQEKCIRPKPQTSDVVSVAPKSRFAEALTEFKGTQQFRR